VIDQNLRANHPIPTTTQFTLVVGRIVEAPFRKVAVKNAGDDIEVRLGGHCRCSTRLAPYCSFSRTFSSRIGLPLGLGRPSAVSLGAG
jgi:hypothetical protein